MAEISLLICLEYKIYSFGFRQYRKLIEMVVELMNKMKVLVLSLLTSVVFLLAGILWWSDGNKIVGVLLFAAALFFGSMGFVQGKKTNKK
jgi:hypothetical protein